MTNTTKWVTDVPVATIWTNKESPREIDQTGIENPLNLNKWYSDLTFDIRKQLCDDKLVQSQLLYGEEVLIDEIDGDWAKIIAIKQPSKKDERGYPGWVPLKQLKEVQTSDWDRDKIALVISDKTLLLNEQKEPTFEISYLTYLPVIQEEQDFIKVKTPNGEGYLSQQDVNIHPSIEDVPKRNGQTIVQLAERFLELPYFWGGMSAFGYDCSGYAYNLYKAIGYKIPRDASDQANAGQEVSYDQLQPGDLLFFNNENGYVHHVGIYHSDGKMIHSALTKKGIEITPLKGTRYEKEFCGARRYIV
ncbi:C40 family peptidase [Bacillaceae bacterium W0354]